MKELPLRNSTQVVIVDDEIYPSLAKSQWRLENGYAVECGTGQKLHWILLGHKEGFTVDHRNRNKLDNQAVNLRWATNAQQNQNRGKSHKNKLYKGVYERRSLKGISHYLAYISQGGIQTCLGKFFTAEEAAAAYDYAAKILHKDFAVTNLHSINEDD